MPEKFSTEAEKQAEKVMRKIASSNSPFEVKTLKRFLKMDPDHKVLIQHPDGKVVPASIEVLVRIMELIHGAREKSAQALNLVPQSESDSSLATSESPSQAAKPSDKGDDPKKLS